MPNLIDRLRPDKHIYEVAQELLKKLKSDKAVFELGGSVAKKTNIQGSSDIDIFARFHKQGKISDELQAVLTKFKPKRVKGSRDYFQFKYKGYAIEIVPVLLITDHAQAKNVTDMSPLHVSWIENKLTPKMRDDIRLAKQFCKAQRIYGAESHIQGFSGHVLDILIVYYRSFQKLLKNSLTWKDKQVIDIEKYGTAKKLSASKVVSPLIVIDPVQPDRNAAAGLSKEAFEKFRKKAENYLSNKNEKMFEVCPLNYSRFKKANLGSVTINFYYTMPKGRSDIIGSKIRQTIIHLMKNTKEFVPTKNIWDFEQCFIAYKIKELPKTTEVKGPPLNQIKNVNKFKKRHKRTFEKNGIIYAEEKTEFTTVLQKIKYLVKQEYVNKRIGKLRWKK